MDLEDWYHTHDFNFAIKSWHRFEQRVDYGTKRILAILAELDIKATFFVLGYVAYKNPGLVKEIADLGHEIASHGGWHRMVSALNMEEFRLDVRYSKQFLEDLTGQEVNKFRAPSWSIAKDTLWALQVLEEEGYICDSSIQPFKTPLSGFKGAPVEPYHPIIDGQRLKLVEVPPTVLSWGYLRIPFAGGFYLRALPAWFSRTAFKAVAKRRPAMLYLHPWELDPGQPRLKVSPLVRFIHYFNLQSNPKKVKLVLHDFNFITLGEFIKNQSFPYRIL